MPGKRLRGLLGRIRHGFNHLRQSAGSSLDFLCSREYLGSRLSRADVAVFFKFRQSPYGGGNQFLSALVEEFTRRGLTIETNRISGRTRACLCNSHNFDVDGLRRYNSRGCRIVHRVDGPIDVYRGQDRGLDRKIWDINSELADWTVFQSQYSLNKHLDLGLVFKSPVVIPNAANPRIFHPRGRTAFDRDRKIRLISVSWSDNPNKGAATYQEIAKGLDWAKYDYTFVGQSQITFKRIRMLAPVPSLELAELLRHHDIYITASAHDPCSNALIEALSCGLPGIYLNSGGHPELVGEAGFPFYTAEEALLAIDRLVDEYEIRQPKIRVPRIDQVADQYLEVLGVSI